MKVRAKKIVMLLLVVALLIMSMHKMGVAATAQPPMLDFVTGFNYDYDTVTPVCAEYLKNGNCKTWGNVTTYNYLLTFSGWNLTGVIYNDLSYVGEGVDPITDAVISIGNLYNSASPDNWQFDSATGAGGGPVAFTISNGSTTYFSGTLDGFTATQDYFGTFLNKGWTLDNITPTSFNASGSQYITELEQAYNNGNKINFGGSFTFLGTGANTTFTGDTSGSFQGKMVVTPEPISSILFVTGAATLAARRLIRKKKESIA